MLVLTRKKFESIAIGPDIVITIIKIDGNKVRVGIEAPAELRILRVELKPEEGCSAARKPHLLPGGDL